MQFKGKNLGVGDLVTMLSPRVPLEFQAAVINVTDGVLEVMSTLLAPFQDSGLFAEDEVDAIEVLCPADVAIPRQSGSKHFSKEQPVSTTIEGSKREGKVVAAFDCVVVARQDDGELVTGGANCFDAA